MDEAPTEVTKPQPGIAKATADLILLQAQQQLTTSRTNKRARLEQIKENEDLYHGIAEKSIRNPFNECFPFMAGYVDHLKSKIDDDSVLQYLDDTEANLKKVRKIQAFYDKVARSVAPNDMWELKHRYAKTNSIFSGVAIYKYWSEKTPEYKSYLYVVSHYDFHFEPRGGGQIENHLFCGEDFIYKNIEDLEDSAAYNQEQVKLLKVAAEKNQTKDSTSLDGDLRNNRAEKLGQDPRNNNYVGQSTVKLVEWYTTYKGVRYYMLFSETLSVWVRCELLVDMFPNNQWPYVVWQTNEDPDVLFSKAPCDDARPVAKIINTMINQELYNRQKRNYGQRGYDAEAFPNVAALADWRPDGLVPVYRKDSSVPISSLVYEFKVGDLSGTLDLVSWLDNFTGRQTGNTPAAQGDSGDVNKQATVFLGEVQQTERLIGIKNKSYRNALSRIGLMFKQGLEYNLDKPQSVKVMGGKGAEWDKLTAEEVKQCSDLSVQPLGGTSELQLKRAKDAAKSAALVTLQVANPQWKERQTLLLAGFTDEEVKDAFSTADFATKELLSEAAQAEQDIVEGKEPKLNRGATPEFMQHIVDFATNTDDLPQEIYDKLMKYAMDHTDIAVENTHRNVREMITARAKTYLSTPAPEVAGAAKSGATISANGGSTPGITSQVSPAAGPVQVAG